MRTHTSPLLSYASYAVLALCMPASLAAASPMTRQPAHLACDAVVQPMGVDSAQPLLSWQLQDDRFAARQTAYRIEVASQPKLLDKPDVWDSGRIESAQSIAVAYAGPALKPETRYYWRVALWDKDGKPYPISDVTWWETGLFKEEWKAQWIGYEEPEHRAIRESGAQWITQ